jgi:hypothetical protein
MDTPAVRARWLRLLLAALRCSPAAYADLITFAERCLAQADRERKDARVSQRA